MRTTCILVFFVTAINCSVKTAVYHSNNTCTPLARHSTCNSNGSECNFFMSIGECLSCGTATCVAIQGVCYFDLENTSIDLYRGEYSIPASDTCQELNDRVCGQLNREGLLCGNCKPGYGPAPYSGSVKCFPCSSRYEESWRWLFYFALELIPSTFFYFAVILFDIRTTSPPYSAFVVFSQLFAVLYKIDPFIRLKLKVTLNRNNILGGLLTLISIWNLDFFRHAVPPFCVSSNLTDLHVALLELVSAFYPLFLIAVTYICIELHARNVRPIVVIWQPLHSCFTRCRRTLNPKSSLIAAFATFLSLSFSKIVFSVYRVGLAGKYSTVDGQNETLRGLYNPNVQGIDDSDYFKQLLKTPYFLPLFIIALLIQLPTLLLLLYPVKRFRRLLACLGTSRYHAISFFVDTFQGHYKDGTNGSRDYRAVSTVTFIIIMVFCVVMANSNVRRGVPNQTDYLATVYVLVVVSLIYGVVQPCKKRYINACESVVYSAAALMLLSWGRGHNIALNKPSINYRYGPFFRLYLSLVVLVLPSLALLLTLLTKVIMRLCCCKTEFIAKLNQISNKLFHRNFSEISPDDIADRLDHPLEYEVIS